MPFSRSFAALAYALFLTLSGSGCTSEAPGADTTHESIVVQGPAAGSVAVSAVGARSVRILHVEPPSIVLLREVFLPADERVVAVQWTHDGRGVIIATRASTFALNTRTWELERVVAVARAGHRLANGHRRG